jgi:hypothetical protein
LSIVGIVLSIVGIIALGHFGTLWWGEPQENTLTFYLMAWISGFCFLFFGFVVPAWITIGYNKRLRRGKATTTA